MANIKSAKKRINTIERRNSENRFVRATLSTMVKKFRKMLEEGKVEEAEKYSKDVYAYIDSACSKGVIHKNAASRKVGRLASALYKAKATETKVEVKVEEPKVEVKEEAPKAEVKKTTTRKTSTKKTTEEKPAEKKTATKKSTKTTEEKPAAEKKTTTRKTATKKAE